MFNKILVVCIGNVCRSPTAEYLFKTKLVQKPGISISSAGLGALIGQAIDGNAGDLLNEHGINAAEHKARQLRSEHLTSADLILTMDNEMVRRIGAIAPQVSGKTFLLGKWADNTPVADPYRKSREAFEFVYQSIDQFTDDWVKYL